MFGINMVPILIEFSGSIRMIVQKFSRLYCHRCIKKKNQYCPTFCLKIKKFFIGRKKTYNELLYEKVADFLNLKIIEKRAALAENQQKNIYYNELIILM